MIGEPEVDGGWETASGDQAVEPDVPRERGRAARRPWLWALGGMVAASAVWAGTLAAQDRFAGTPRIDYRHAGNLCQEVLLESVGKTVDREVRDAGSNDASEGRSGAQDWAHCGIHLRNGKEPLAYQAQVLVELHKKTDPGPEFATGPLGNTTMRMDPAERREVPGLGDRAVLDQYYGGSGDRLMVLDGGAVFTLTVEWFATSAGEQAPVDEDAIDAAMIEDVRALMAKLRK